MEAELIKEVLLTWSWIDENIIGCVVKMRRTLHNNDTNQYSGRNIWWNTFFVLMEVGIDESNAMLK